MTDKIRTHRAALDGHTECGISLDKPGLVCQPTSGSPEPPNCKRCLHTLTRFCGPCKQDTVRERVLDRIPVYSAAHPQGEPIESLRCSCGHIGIGNMEPIGAKERQRQLKQQRAQARIRRQHSAESSRARRADVMGQEQAEYPHPNTCALCDEPLPLPLSELYGYHRHYRGFSASAITFLPWYYCLDHRDIGRQLDETLIATFKRDALDIRDAAVQRLQMQARNNAH